MENAQLQILIQLPLTLDMPLTFILLLLENKSYVTITLSYMCL